jgi:hypothetical protein
MPWVSCADCGEGFWREADQPWKRYCLECWIDRKNRDREAECDALAERVAELERVLDFILTGISEHWPFLLKRAHPDTNGGADVATETTKWLIAARELAQTVRHPCN